MDRKHFRRRRKWWLPKRLAILILRSSLSDKVKHQGHNFQKKKVVAGAFVFHKHILFYNSFSWLAYVIIILDIHNQMTCHGDLTEQMLKVALTLFNQSVNDT